MAVYEQNQDLVQTSSGSFSGFSVVTFVTWPIVICYTILNGKFVLGDQEHINQECGSSFHKNTDTEIN